MIHDVQSIDIGGNRVVRVGSYTLDAGDGDGPHRRVFMAAGWASSPPLPVHAETVDIPAAAVPEIVAALRRVGGKDQDAHANDDTTAPAGER